MKPKPNLPLLKRLRTRFLRMQHAEHFNMDTWGTKTECGTTACIAGHALLLAGYRMRRAAYDGEYEFVSPKGRVVHPPIAARRELRLSRAVTSGDFTSGSPGLFYDCTIDTPKAAAARIQEIIKSVEDAR